MDVSGQLHAMAVLYPKQRPPVPIWQEAAWAPDPVWTQWWRRGIPSLPPTGNRTPVIHPVTQSLYWLTVPHWKLICKSPRLSQRSNHTIEHEGWTTCHALNTKVRNLTEVLGRACGLSLLEMFPCNEANRYYKQLSCSCVCNLQLLRYCLCLWLNSPVK